MTGKLSALLRLWRGGFWKTRSLRQGKHMKNMSMDEALALPSGVLLRLRYDWVNAGEFWWLHDRVEDDRVFGRFRYDGDAWSPVGDYLYEFMDEVCRGSGAEPVILVERIDRAQAPERFSAVLGDLDPMDAQSVQIGPVKN